MTAPGLIGLNGFLIDHSRSCERHEMLWEEHGPEICEGKH